MLTNLKVLKDAQHIRPTFTQGSACTFLGVYAHVFVDSGCQISDSVAFQTYAKIRGFVFWRAVEIYRPLRGAIEESL